LFSMVALAGGYQKHQEARVVAPVCAVPGPSSIAIETIVEDPKLVLVHDFVSPEEVKHLLDLAEGKWTRSRTTRGQATDLHDNNTRPEEAAGCGCAEKDAEVAAGTAEGEDEEEPQGRRNIESQTRTSWEYRLGYSESPVVERVLARVATLTGHPYENVERPVLLRYHGGEYFKVHHDGGFRPMSMFAYLNDVPAGGETHFPRLGLKVKPLACTALMWSNIVQDEDGNTIADRRMDHEGCPPESGHMKYAIALFVNSEKQHEAAHIKIVQKS